jgi:hypothetical protein
VRASLEQLNTTYVEAIIWYIIGANNDLPDIIKYGTNKATLLMVF